MNVQSDITLCTINARYIHASLGLRYLYANMGALHARTTLTEFTLAQRAEDIVELLLHSDLRIIGFGVYIWNVSLTTEVIRLIKIIRPDIKIIVGGPEVSYETDQQSISKVVDYVISGAADLRFAELCQDILDEQASGRHVSSLPFELGDLQSPYRYYTDEDIAHRVLYVEASRGCPFKCEFCLSSLDKTAVPFDLDAFLHEMQLLIDRGARHFKFVDRTFNLKADTSKQILEFFLKEIEGRDSDNGLFLHFELIPDRLPDVLLELLPRFPTNSLQFEIGIQSFNPEVQKRISRKQNTDKTHGNLRWLREHTQAHIHADLIFGLPGETLSSFGQGFNQLYSLAPQEIQVGILKRLRGTPITRHTAEFDMRYMNTPPYRILAHRDADFETVQRMIRFARYWDLVGNSGRFLNTLPILLAEQPFENFMAFSDWLFDTTVQTHKIALKKLFTMLYEFLCEYQHMDTEFVQTQLLADYANSGMKGQLVFEDRKATSLTAKTTGAARQHRHAGAS